MRQTASRLGAAAKLAVVCVLWDSEILLAVTSDGPALEVTNLALQAEELAAVSVRRPAKAR
ncbi:MAG: hypothetical protein ACYC1D_15560 [Acidimicrobiales bacterium]